MSLGEMAAQYRISSALCRVRARELERALRDDARAGRVRAMDAAQRRRRIAVLRTMAHDCGATAAYLENYSRGGLSFERYI